MYKYFWTESQRKNFEEICKDIFKNIYCSKDAEAESRVSWWILMYGLTDSKLRNNKKISKINE